METSLLKMQHSSLQFNDSRKKQKQDIHDLFSEGTDYPVKTGTEAGLSADGSNANREFLKEFAEEYNHAFHFARDNWIAIDRKIIVPRTVERGSVFVMDNDDLTGKMQDRVMATIEFDHVDSGIGTVAVGAVHYPTKGATPGSPNYDANFLYAKKIAKWMETAGFGRSLAFVNGDFNMPDRTLDWSFGEDFTSMADELEAWQNTGHGPIDGFCSYDKDGRVSAKEFIVLDDKEFFQFSDHYVCRGVWEVRNLQDELKR